MMEHQANALALIFGGKPWQPYPGHWLLIHSRDDGSLVIFDNDVINAYDNCEAMEDGEPSVEIRLNVS